MHLFENRIWLARLNFFLVHDVLAKEKGSSQYYADTGNLFVDAVVANVQHASTDPDQQRMFDEIDTALLGDFLRATGHSAEEVEKAHEVHRSVMSLARDALASMVPAE